MHAMCSSVQFVIHVVPDPMPTFNFSFWTQVSGCRDGARKSCMDRLYLYSCVCACPNILHISIQMSLTGPCIGQTHHVYAHVYTHAFIHFDAKIGALSYSWCDLCACQWFPLCMPICSVLQNARPMSRWSECESLFTAISADAGSKG